MIISPSCRKAPEVVSRVQQGTQVYSRIYKVQSVFVCTGG